MLRRRKRNIGEAQTTDVMFSSLLVAINKLSDKIDTIKNDSEITCEEVNFAFNVPVATRVRLEDVPPFSGKVSTVKRMIPPGANGLVDLAYGINLKRYPIEGFFSFDDVSDEVVINYPVNTSSVLWVEYVNRDAVNPHQPTVIMVVKKDA